MKLVNVLKNLDLFRSRQSFLCGGLTTLLSSILFLFLTIESSFAEVTGYDTQSTEGVMNCGTLTTTSEAKFHFRLGTSPNYTYPEYKTPDGKSNLTYPAGQVISIKGFSDNFVKFEFENSPEKTGFPNQRRTAYIPASNFSKEAFDRARAKCEAETDALTDSTPGFGDGSATNWDSVEMPESVVGSDHVSENHSSHFKNAVCNLRNFYKEENRKEQYAFINIPNGHQFKTYVINISSGQVIDQFDSLKSPGGMGCATNHTRPGIFRLSNQLSPTPKTRRTWWGSAKINGRTVRRPAYVITNVGGHLTKYGGGGTKNKKCRSNDTIKAHMNTNMKGASSGSKKRYSHGCLITSKEKFEQHTIPKAGNALIVNFDPSRDLHPNCKTTTAN